MLASSIRVDFEDLRVLGFAGISGSYAAIGTPFVHPGRMIKVSNGTDANLVISFNGIDDKDVVFAGQSWIYDFCSNKADCGGSLELPAGRRIYVKEELALATLGNVYITYIYASQV